MDNFSIQEIKGRAVGTRNQRNVIVVIEVLCGKELHKGNKKREGQDIVVYFKKIYTDDFI